MNSIRVDTAEFERGLQRSLKRIRKFWTQYVLTYCRVHDSDRRIKWWAGLVQCRLCGHKYVCVVPVEHEDDDVLTRLECSNCGNMTAEKIDV